MARRDSAELTVVYRDPWLLVADKPQGVLVHGDGTGAPTLSDAVRDAVERAGASGAWLEAGGFAGGRAAPDVCVFLEEGGCIVSNGKTECGARRRSFRAGYEAAPLRKGAAS